MSAADADELLANVTSLFNVFSNGVLEKKSSDERRDLTVLLKNTTCKSDAGECEVRDRNLQILNSKLLMIGLKLELHQDAGHYVLATEKGITRTSMYVAKSVMRWLCDIILPYHHKCCIKGVSLTNAVRVCCYDDDASIIAKYPIHAIKNESNNMNEMFFKAISRMQELRFLAIEAEVNVVYSGFVRLIKENCRVLWSHLQELRLRVWSHQRDRQLVVMSACNPAELKVVKLHFASTTGHCQRPLNTMDVQFIAAACCGGVRQFSMHCDPVHHPEGEVGKQHRLISCEFAQRLLCNSLYKCEHITLNEAYLLPIFPHWDNVRCLVLQTKAAEADFDIATEYGTKLPKNIVVVHEVPLEGKRASDLGISLARHMLTAEIIIGDTKNEPMPPKMAKTGSHACAQLTFGIRKAMCRHPTLNWKKVYVGDDFVRNLTKHAFLDKFGKKCPAHDIKIVTDLTQDEVFVEPLQGEIAEFVNSLADTLPNLTTLRCPWMMPGVIETITRLVNIKVLDCPIELLYSSPEPEEPKMVQVAKVAKGVFTDSKLVTLKGGVFSTERTMLMLKDLMPSSTTIERIEGGIHVNHASVSTKLPALQLYNAVQGVAVVYGKSLSNALLRQQKSASLRPPPQPRSQVQRFHAVAAAAAAAAVASFTN